MIKFTTIAVLATTMFSPHASAFWGDKTDYTMVENMFTAAKAGNMTAKSPLFEYKYNKFCTGGTIYTTKYNKYNKSKKSHTGGKLPSWFFAKSFGHAIASYIEGESAPDLAYKKQEVVDEFIPYLVQAAEEKYFTINKWTKGGSSVAYAQTMILINLSVFMDFADHKGLWKTGQRDKIVNWGNTLYGRSHYSHHQNDGRTQSNRWPDTVSKAAAAYMLWGYVNKDLDVFKDGYKDLLQEYKKIPADGKYHQHIYGKYAGAIQKSWNLFIENKTIGDLVIASYVGELVGMETFDKPNKKGGTVRKMVEHLGELSADPKVRKGQDERHLWNMRDDGNSWMTVYRLLDDTDTNPLVKMHLETSNKKGYKYQQILNYSRCLANEVD